jgi:hypothetical protein
MLNSGMLPLSTECYEKGAHLHSVEDTAISKIESIEVNIADVHSMGSEMDAILHREVLQRPSIGTVQIIM